MSDNFNFCTDNIIEKAETKDYYEIEGICSTEDQDLQNEIIAINGIDLSEINAGKGYINSDHGAKYDNKDLARMGIIDEAKVTPKGLWIKAKIWKNHPEAMIYYNEMKYGKPGLVQFSVEGGVLERDNINKNKIKRAKILGVALTRNPVNPNTFAKFAKSFAEEKTEDIEKGGIGSGRKPTGGKKLTEEQLKRLHAKKIGNEQEHKVKEIKVGEAARKKESASEKKEKEAKEEKESTSKQTDKETVAPNSTELNTQTRTRENKQNLIDRMVDQAKTEEEKKEVRAKIKEMGLRGKPRKTEEARKVKIKKSELLKEILRRMDISEEFKKSILGLLEKAMTSGGPVYSNTLASDFTQGQVFQQEGREEKKKKNKKETNNG